MANAPDMVVQFAHYLEQLWREKGQPDVEVRAQVLVSLNGRKRQNLIDPAVDLTRMKDSLAPKRWIVPLHEPLPLRSNDVPEPPALPIK
jgi:hypothetical protein